MNVLDVTSVGKGAFEERCRLRICAVRPRSVSGEFAVAEGLDGVVGKVVVERHQAESKRIGFTVLCFDVFGEPIVDDAPARVRQTLVGDLTEQGVAEAHVTLIDHEVFIQTLPDVGVEDLGDQIGEDCSSHLGRKPVAENCKVAQDPSVDSG